MNEILEIYFHLLGRLCIRYDEWCQSPYFGKALTVIKEYVIKAASLVDVYQKDILAGVIAVIAIWVAVWLFKQFRRYGVLIRFNFKTILCVLGIILLAGMAVAGHYIISMLIAMGILGRLADKKYHHGDERFVLGVVAMVVTCITLLVTGHWISAIIVGLGIFGVYQD